LGPPIVSFVSLRCAGGGLCGFDVLERADEAGAQLAELAGVVGGEGVEEAAAFAGDAEENAAAVCGVVGAEEEALGDGAIDELDDGVVAEAQALGGVGDGGEGARGGSCDLEEELVLLGVELELLGGLLAELEEGSELVAELGEGLEEVGLVVG
jgi:hypothetical protein